MLALDLLNFILEESKKLPTTKGLDKKHKKMRI
jgi:hypothetical protein